jgi:hypothetical protein
MLPQNAISAVAAVFIVAMVWLRTRMHYRGASGRRTLTTAGALYFAALAALLAAGWFAAPLLGRALTGSPPVAPAFARVLWFLGVYYLFIAVHLSLRARGVSVFRPRGSPEGGIA